MKKKVCHSSHSWWTHNNNRDLPLQWPSKNLRSHCSGRSPCSFSRGSCSALVIQCNSPIVQQRIIKKYIIYEVSKNRTRRFPLCWSLRFGLLCTRWDITFDDINYILRNHFKHQFKFPFFIIYRVALLFQKNKYIHFE